MEDLSQKGPIRVPIATREGCKKFRLSDEEVAQYHRDGFVVSKEPIFTDEEVDEMRRELDSLKDPENPHPGLGLLYEHHYNETGDPSNHLFHCLGHWRVSECFHDLPYHPALVAVTSQLMGDTGVRFWHDQLFAKPPKFGGCVQWHQDYSYWTRSVPMNHMTVHIALDDQTEENGGLQYLPGSHRWTRDDKPLPTPSGKRDLDKDSIDSAAFTGEMDAIQTVLSEEEKAEWKENGPRIAGLKKGHVSWHHPLALHGSFPNKTDAPRRAAVVNYFAEGTTAGEECEPLKGVGTFQKDQAFDGPFFPLVLQ